MPKYLKVISSLNPNPPSFLKKLSKVSRPTSMMRASKFAKRRGFITLDVVPSVQNMQIALSSLETALVAMASNEIDKISSQALYQIKQRSGSQGGIKSPTLSKSWRKRFIPGAKIRAIMHRAGREPQAFGLKRFGARQRVGTLLHGYAIFTNNRKFLEPIQTKVGVTDLLEILEYGSRPHIIKPKKSRGRLKFEWEGARTDLPVLGSKTFLGFFGQGVKHPGTKPYGFTRITVAEAAGRMLALQYKLKSARFILGR